MGSSDGVGLIRRRTRYCRISIGSMLVIFFSCLWAIAGIISVESTSGNFEILHEVPEGHVGVYWRGGALTRAVTAPGFHLKMPFITKFAPIQVTIQTKVVVDVPCGTKGGVMITFDKIEVIHRLRKEYVYDTLLNFGVYYEKTWIYDKILHEINQFCSCKSLQEIYIDIFDQIADTIKETIQRDCNKYAPGIEIISVRVSKPTIPAEIQRNYELLEEQHTKELIAIQKQKLADREAGTNIKVVFSKALTLFYEVIIKRAFGLFHDVHYDDIDGYIT